MKLKSKNHFRFFSIKTSIFSIIKIFKKDKPVQHSLIRICTVCQSNGEIVTAQLISAFVCAT